MAAHLRPGLSDPVPGHLGLARPDAGGDAILMLPFDELATTAPPSDLAGNLAPLISPFAMPEVVSGWTGRARDFAPGLTTALEALDQVDGLTLAARDMSIEVLLTMRLASSSDYPRAILQRGRADGTAAERVNYRLQVEKVAATSPQQYEIVLDWQNVAGTWVSPAAGARFFAPSDLEFHYLVATRRLERGLAVTRYYVNGIPIGEFSVAVDQVGGATTGHTLVGIGHDGGGYTTGIWDGIVDQLRVVDFEMSPEEVEATWLRLAKYQRDGELAFRALAPPGSAWAKPTAETRWGKLSRLAGEALGHALAKVEELRSNWLPTRAYREVISLWEELVVASPRPRDSLDVRRGRVVDLMGRENGFAVPQVQIAMAEVFDQDDADVEIIEFSNRVVDDFSVGSPARWTVHGSLWSIGSGTCETDLSAGGGAINYEAERVTMALSSGRGRVLVQGEVSAYAGVCPTDVVVGLVVMNELSGDAVLFGIRHHGGNDQLGYVLVTAGVAGAFVQVLAAAFAEPLWLRVVRGPAGRAADDAASTTWRLSWSVDDAVSGFTDTDVTHATLEPTEAGMAAYSTGVYAAGSEGATFDSIVVDTPMGLRPFEWYAYRDLGLAGSPQIVRADALVRRLKPAHTGAAAIASLDVLCDDELLGLCDHGPCGGL